MDAAARLLLGEHDFAAYCRQRRGHDQAALAALRVATHRRRLRWRRVEADAFCHSMVRSLVGALLAVGEGRRDIGWPAGVLQRGVRDSAVQVAAAHGLTLE